MILAGLLVCNHCCLYLYLSFNLYLLCFCQIVHTAFPSCVRLFGIWQYWLWLVAFLPPHTQPFTIASHPHWNRFHRTGVGCRRNDIKLAVIHSLSRSNHNLGITISSLQFTNHSSQFAIHKLQLKT